MTPPHSLLKVAVTESPVSVMGDCVPKSPAGDTVEVADGVTVTVTVTVGVLRGKAAGRTEFWFDSLPSSKAPAAATTTNATTATSHPPFTASLPSPAV
jgi:hypothetical protein